jgi:hypothetical protein
MSDVKIEDSKPTFRNWLYSKRTDKADIGVLARRVCHWDGWESPDELRAELTARGVSVNYIKAVAVVEQTWRHRLKHTIVSVPLDDHDVAALVELTNVYGSPTKVIRHAIRVLAGRTPSVSRALPQRPA